MLLLVVASTLAKNETATVAKNAPMSVSYRTDRGTVIYYINPQNEDIYLTISAEVPESSIGEDDTLKNSADSSDAMTIDTAGSSSFTQNRAPLTGKVLQELRKAQESFYGADYQQALHHVNESLKLQKSAEGYALRGTILYMQQDIRGAEYSWQEALKYNPDMPGVVDMLSRTATQGVN